MWEKLKESLEKSKADITGRKIASTIVLEDGSILSGWNKENSIENIFHAEASMIPSIPEKSVIQEIHMMAYGKPMNIKYSIPCENCTNLLLPFTGKDTKVFFYFYQKDIRFEVPFCQIAK